MNLKVRLAKGAISGVVATLPMTLVMVLAQRLIPTRKKAKLPPTEITERATGDKQLSPLMHYAFGGGAGIAYSVLAGKTPLPPAAEGLAFGLGVYGASYEGFLPETGLIEPTKKWTDDRVLMMVVAHAVWGASLGLLFRRLNS